MEPPNVRAFILNLNLSSYLRVSDSKPFGEEGGGGLHVGRCRPLLEGSGSGNRAFPAIVIRFRQKLRLSSGSTEGVWLLRSSRDRKGHFIQNATYSPFFPVRSELSL